MIMRRTDAEAIRLDTPWAFGEDTVVCERLLKRGMRIRYIPDLVVLHSRRPLWRGHLRRALPVVPPARRVCPLGGHQLATARVLRPDAAHDRDRVATSPPVGSAPAVERGRSSSIWQPAPSPAATGNLGVGGGSASASSPRTSPTASALRSHSPVCRCRKIDQVSAGSSPSVCVIVPTRNSAATLPRALDSLARPDYHERVGCSSSMPTPGDETSFDR